MTDHITRTEGKYMDKKVIIITGASNGFGKLASIEFATRGYRVFAAMRDSNGRNKPARDALLSTVTGHALKVIDMDVTDDASVQTAIDGVARDAGRIDVLINNAGVMNVGVTEAYTTEQVRQQFDVNVFGSVRTDRAVLPHMRRAKSGLLIHVSSLAGRVVFPFFGVYCASKFALEALAEAYRYELSSFGVDSVIVEPGPYPSNLLPVAPMPADSARLATYGEVAKVPEQMKGGFQQMYDGENPPDPSLVVAAYVRLVEATEKRPVRTVVMPTGMDFGVERLNAAASPFQNELMKMLGMEAMT